jgi:xanthine dehydrogenase YagS FAD-binding subunit
MRRDTIPSFDLYEPDSLDTALELLHRFGDDGWPLAGGYDSMDWFKDRTKQPKAVIDLNPIAELHGIRETTDGVEIGALTTLTEIECSPLIKAQFGLLAEATRRVASPQIRNAATLGGNVCQDTRCWYYRYGLDCYRAGGNVCYAAAPDGQDREHCLFGADRCIAVTPSDTAPALVALDAEMVIHSTEGERVVRAEDFFMMPSVDITRMTVLRPTDILTAIRLPSTWAGANFYFEKVADRNTWDFALVNVAAALSVSDGVIRDIRLACGGVQCIPRRLTDVENDVRGRAHNSDTAERAGALAVAGAAPLNYNHFKIPLMKNLVTRAVRNA